MVLDAPDSMITEARAPAMGQMMMPRMRQSAAPHWRAPMGNMKKSTAFPVSIVLSRNSRPVRRIRVAAVLVSAAT